MGGSESADIAIHVALISLIRLRRKRTDESLKQDETYCIQDLE